MTEYLIRTAATLLLIIGLLHASWTSDIAFASGAPKTQARVLSDNTITSLRAKEETAFHHGVSAYIWGCSLVRTERLQRDRVTQSSPGVPQAALNQFGHVRDLRDSSYKAIPTPNNDTIYSQAFLDLRKEPIVVHVPDVAGRYYVLPLLSAFQDVFAGIGTRETGTKAGDYAIVGPNWKGKLAKGLTRIDAPTDTVIIWGRIGANGKDDLKEARAVQDAISLVPLSQLGQMLKTPAPDWEASRKRVAKTSRDKHSTVPKSLAFFDELGKALKFTSSPRN